MTDYPTTHDTANGPLSYWRVSIPTRQPGGIVAGVRLYHGERHEQRDGHAPALHATLTDRDGTWYRNFASPEEWVEWLDTMATGPVERASDRLPVSRLLAAMGA